MSKKIIPLGLTYLGHTPSTSDDQAQADHVRRYGQLPMCLHRLPAIVLTGPIIIPGQITLTTRPGTFRLN